MKNITSGTLLLLFPFLILIPGCQKENVTPVLAKHEKQYPEIRKKYVYQSLIRLAKIKKDPDFEKLIKKYQGHKGLTFLHENLIGRQWQQALLDVDVI